MKRWIVSLIVLSVIVGSCSKEVVPAYSREKPHMNLSRGSEIQSGALIGDVLRKPFPPDRPDTMRRPEFPKLPRLPLEPFVPLGQGQCIYSYDELVGILGSNKFPAKAVVLDGGPLGDITLERSDNLPGIWYTAVAGATGSSLFRSQLLVEWRPDPGVYFSGFGADVWAAGCVYNYPSLGAFTNILKGGMEITINTCFFWSVGEYAGLRIKYLVID